MNARHRLQVFAMLLFVLFPNSMLFSQIIHPHLKIKASGAVSDFFTGDSTIILSTDAGTIETFSVANGDRIDFYGLPKMNDFMGDPVSTKVLSLDKYDELLLIVTQGNHGFSNVFIKKGEKEIQLFDADLDRLMIKKARFVNSTQVLMGLLSNDLMLYNIEKKEIVYKISISPYTFSDFDLSEEKDFVFTSDESGIVHKISVQDGNIIDEYSGNNVDNVFKIATGNGLILTAGQDRRIGVYQPASAVKYYLQREFLVYCVGLSANGKIGAFTADEENTIVLFDTSTKQEEYRLKGHQGIVTKIEIIDKHTVVSSSEDGYLMIWK